MIESSRFHPSFCSQNAIAVSLDLKTTATVKETPGSKGVLLNLPSLSFSTDWHVEEFESKAYQLDVNQNIEEPNEILHEYLEQFVREDVSAAVSQACKVFIYLYTGFRRKLNGRKEVGFEVTVSSELPPGAGLGSSAAFSTSLTAALINFFKEEKDVIPKELISKWAFKCEHIFHGKPSGIDNSICTFGGAVHFRDGKVVQHLTAFPRMPALLVYTNVMRNTKMLVERVSRKREKYASVIHHTMEAIDTISTTAWGLIKEGNYNGLQREELVDMNQQLLNLLGAGHETIDKVLSIAKKHGQIGKLTGAGGGGCVILHLNPGWFLLIKDRVTAFLYFICRHE